MAYQSFTRQMSLDRPNDEYIPIGGAAGTVLAKHSNVDRDVEWSTPRYIPDGGTAGYALAKASGTDYDAAWVDPASWISALTSSEIDAIIATIN